MKWKKKNVYIHILASTSTSIISSSNKAEHIGAMTMDDTIDEIPHNMMGIKSESLYMTLESITREHDVSILNANVPSQLLPELIEHLSDTIPNDIFIQRSEVELNSLKRLGDVLRDKFLETGNYPFTMQRICELCFDPFKYFKVNELGKFINALEKCCCCLLYTSRCV